MVFILWFCQFGYENQYDENMITAGLTNNDLKMLDMSLDELKKYQNGLLKELSELNEVLEAIGKDPGMIFSETSSRVDAYFESRNSDYSGGV